MPIGIKGTTTVVLDGKSFDGFYTSTHGKLRVTCDFGSKAKQTDGSPVSAQARRMLIDLVTNNVK